MARELSSRAPMLEICARSPTRPESDQCRLRSNRRGKQRMRDAIAGRDAELLGGAGDHFEHAAHRPARRDDRSDSGSVFSAIRRMRPSPRMKIMSSET